MLRILIAASSAFVAAIAHADLVYVANSNNNTIVKFTEQGIGSVFAPTSSRPNGLAFDTAGNLYVALPDLNRIERFSPTGVNLGAFATTGLDNPGGLAFDIGGNLYVANRNNTIRRFTATGFDLGSFATTGLRQPLVRCHS